MSSNQKFATRSLKSYFLNKYQKFIQVHFKLQLDYANIYPQELVKIWAPNTFSPSLTTGIRFIFFPESSLCEKRTSTEFFLPVFPEFGLNSVRIQENTDQENSVLGHF